MANVVFLDLNFLQVHHVRDGVEHLVEKRVLHCVAGLTSRDADRLGSWVAETKRTLFLLQK